ncbi:MAG: DivIVA domain-containing protein [Acidimicrobiales bacterium]|jgi:cell division septum initiation protein DivIVA
MAENMPNFAEARRGGYDQGQVTAYVGGLIREMETAHSKVAELSRLVERLHAENNTYKQKAGSRYSGFGERIDQILLLAESEAAEVRQAATSEAERLKAEVEKWAASLWEDSKRQAEGIRADAERDALATRSEAQAYFEAQRTNAAKVAAELEATIAARREQAEQENGDRLSAVSRQVAAAEEHAAQMRVDADRLRSETEIVANKRLADAERRAHEIIEEARANADRVRADSERELAAAMERRDLIDTQLGNLRHALSALSTLASPEVTASLERASRAPSRSAPSGHMSDNDGPLADLTEGGDAEYASSPSVVQVRTRAAVRHIGSPGLSVARETEPEKREPA